MDYYLSDGVYGWMHNQMVENFKFNAKTIRKNENLTSSVSSTLWGPTCDSYDCVYKKLQLPLMQEGDWLLFENQGAYSGELLTKFNSIAEASMIIDI